MTWGGLFEPSNWARKIAFSRSTSPPGTWSRVTYCGLAAAMCMAISRASCWNSSVRATKSDSQPTSTSTPTCPPMWM